MVALSLLSGVSGSEQAEFVTQAPLNLEPVVIDSGLSKGQLRATSGAITFADGPGVDRGGVLWNGVIYRVMGTKLVQVGQDESITVLGDVGGTDPVRLDYSFDKLIIRSDQKLWYWDGTTLSQVTDPDLGPVKDVLWVDGYTMTTDGTAIVVTELDDPFQVKPLKYGSAEEDPDMIVGLMKTHGEVHAIGRNTIQPQQNVGGNGFPFQSAKGATIPYGCVGVNAKAPFSDTYAFVGSARNQALGVRVAGQGDAARISNRALEDALAAESDPAGITMETRTYRDEQRLFVHLTAESWVFMTNASQAAKEPVWYRVQSNGAYRIRNAVECNGRFCVGDLNSSALGWLSDDTNNHFGDEPGWEFYTQLIYNEGKSGLLRDVELAGLPGRWTGTGGATAFMSMTRDGRSWSQERAISVGKAGQTTTRMQWRPHTRFTNYMGLRFRGENHAMPGFARCEARLDGLGR